MDRPPTENEMAALLGESLLGVWTGLRALVEERYDAEPVWNAGGKAWTYERAYRKGGRRLCSLRFEADRQAFSEPVRAAYDAARTYRDGKWVMFEPIDESSFARLLRIKRRPDRGYGRATAAKRLPPFFLERTNVSRETFGPVDSPG